MGVLLKIAYRNLREHKVKTLIIGSIIALGLIVLVVGNSLLDTAEEGIRKMYTDNFTGQILIADSQNENPSLFMGGGMDGEPIPTIQGFRELADYLAGLEGIESRVAQNVGYAIANLDGEGGAFLQLFSVNPRDYLNMFPATVEIVEGRFLEEDETGIVLSEAVVTTLEETTGRDVKVGEKILLTNINAVSGTKIREVEIKGILRFPSETPNLSFISYLDVTTMRILSGMTKFTDSSVDLTIDEQDSLGTVSEDDIFGGGDLFAGADLVTDTPNDEDLLNILGDTSETDIYRELDADAWQYMLLKLEKGRSPLGFIRDLNSFFEENQLNLKAHDWVEAAGQVAQLVSGLKLVFNGLIFIVAIVAIIIIMNTLVISVTERIGEIGTMRAIGGQRSFVRGMIILETLMISLVFGSAGILVGGGVIAVLNATGIEATNLFTQVLFGGPVLNPVLSPTSVVTSLVMVVAVGILASLYPVQVALRIEPVRAMSQR